MVKNKERISEAEVEYAHSLACGGKWRPRGRLFRSDDTLDHLAILPDSRKPDCVRRELQNWGKIK